MRKSVERRKQREREQQQQKNQPTARPRRRWLIIVLSLLLLSATAALGLTYLDHSERAASAKRAEDQKREFAALAKRLAAAKQKKIDDAKRAEAEAAAKAAETLATRKAEAAAKPAGTVAKTGGCDITNPAAITVIVNKKHCFSPIDWTPSDLTSVDGYYLRAEAASHMQQMMTDAATAGMPFAMTSAYRSYANQQATYDHWVVTNGSQALADTVSARAGYSDHQTGMAADLKTEGCVLDCFGTTAQYAWLAEHAADYGFIRRYPEDLTAVTGYSPESWHWRYVGAATAKDMKAKGIQTMEQYFGVSGGDYS